MHYASNNICWVPSNLNIFMLSYVVGWNYSSYFLLIERKTKELLEHFENSSSNAGMIALTLRLPPSSSTSMQEEEVKYS